MTKINILLAIKVILLFTLLNISLTRLFHLTGFSFLKMVLIGMMNIAGILIVIFFLKERGKWIGIHPYFQTVFFLLILWSIFTITRSMTTNSKELTVLFGHYAVGAWPWMLPLCIVFGFNIENWLKSFSYISMLLLIGICATSSVLFIDSARAILEWLLLFPIFYLTILEKNTRNKILIAVAIFMFLLVSYILSTRTSILMIIILTFLVLIEYFRQKNINIHKKIISFLLLSLILLYASSQFQNFYNNYSRNKELTTDTRTFLFEEMFLDMTIQETIIGRGALGTYYSEFFYSLRHLSNIEGGDHFIRSESEVGYLHMILKGGYIMMVLYLMFLLPAAFLGIFRSKNIIARMSGYYILTYLILWAVSFRSIFSPSFIFLWMAAGTTISSTVRNMKIQYITQRERF